MFPWGSAPVKRLKIIALYHSITMCIILNVLIEKDMDSEGIMPSTAN